MSTFQLSILTPDENFYEGLVTHVIVTTSNGQDTFMADHWDSIVQLDIGIITVTLEDGTNIRIANNGGTAVFKNNTLTISTIDAETITGRKPDLTLFTKTFVAKNNEVEKQIQEALEQGGVFESETTLSALFQEERLAKIQVLNEMIKGL
jgi:F0F1-type ATP synthase epsilon subunit